MRNPNGYGSVVYLGKNRRKPYAVRVTNGYKLEQLAPWSETAKTNCQN